MTTLPNDAGLRAGAIYRYYNSNEDRLRAVVDDGIKHNQNLFQSTVPSSDSPFQALQELGQHVWAEMDDYDELICAIQMALISAADPGDFGIELSRTSHPLRQMLKEMVERAQGAGEINPNVDAATLAVILQARTSGIQLLERDSLGDVDVEAALDLIVQRVARLGNQPLSDDER